MSDLQCPARFLLARTRPTPEPGERVAATSGAPADLEEPAARHRGETVVVLGEHGHEADVVMLEVDGDGRRLIPRT